MPISHIQTLNWQSGSDVAQGQVTYTGDGETRVNETLTNSISNRPIAVVLTLSLLQSVYMKSDYDVFIKAVPYNNVIALKAGKPLVWGVNNYLTCPFLSNVSELQYTNTCGTMSPFVGNFLFQQP